MTKCYQISILVYIIIDIIKMHNIRLKMINIRLNIFITNTPVEIGELKYKFQIDLFNVSSFLLHLII